MLGAPVLLLFAAIWYLPLFLKHRKIVKEPIRYYIFAFLLGLASVLLAMGIQIGVGFLTKNLKTEGTATVIRGILNVLIVVAVTEEMIKFFLGYLVVRKIPGLTEAGCMLIIGAVGLGFETLETTATFNVLNAAIRGLTALHIMFQLWMGKFWWRARKSRETDDAAGYKKNLAIAFTAPILVHAIFDYLILKAVKLVEDGVVSQMTGLFMTALALIVAFAFIVITEISAYRTVREERRQFEAATAVSGAEQSSPAEE